MPSIVQIIAGLSALWDQNITLTTIGLLWKEQKFSYKIHLKILSATFRPFSHDLSVLIECSLITRLPWPAIFLYVSMYWNQHHTIHWKSLIDDYRMPFSNAWWLHPWLLHWKHILKVSSKDIVYYPSLFANLCEWLSLYSVACNFSSIHDYAMTQKLDQTFTNLRNVSKSHPPQLGSYLEAAEYL